MAQLLQHAPEQGSMMLEHRKTLLTQLIKGQACRESADANGCYDLSLSIPHSLCHRAHSQLQLFIGKCDTLSSSALDSRHDQRWVDDLMRSDRRRKIHQITLDGFIAQPANSTCPVAEPYAGNRAPRPTPVVTTLAASARATNTCPPSSSTVREIDSPRASRADAR